MKYLNYILLFAFVGLVFGAGVAYAGETPSAPDAKEYFINLKNGDEVSSPFLVQFGLSGMGVAPAGIEKDNTGHHHVLIDTDVSPEEMTLPLPSDEHHKHFGGGQTETVLELAPGTHTLQLLLADWSHVPHNPPVISEKITITVK